VLEQLVRSAPNNRTEVSFIRAESCMSVSFSVEG
jgi:hypothetical protein